MGGSSSEAAIAGLAGGLLGGVVTAPLGLAPLGATVGAVNGVISGRRGIYGGGTAKGVAAFFTYLSSAEVQADWHQFTGYLPITTAAYELTAEQGFYEENPGTDTAIKQMTNKAPTQSSKGLRLGSFVQIRDIINEELEAIWSVDKSAKEGLDAAVARGNELLRQFEDDNS